MSFTVPSQRLALRCLSCNSPIRPRASHQYRRTAASSSKGGSDKNKQGQEVETRSNPVLDEYKRQNPDGAPSQGVQRPSVRAGDISASSIFEDDRRVQTQRQRDASAAEGDGGAIVGGQTRDPSIIQRVVDPDPNARERWERRKVIQLVRKGGRLSKAEFVKRTEREHLARSHNFKTSVKKLGMLARQIAGKSVDDAITQMRFSKKKVAREVLKQLEFARDEAIVSRGMGLGATQPKQEAPNLNETSPLMTAPAPRPTQDESSSVAPVDIRLKDGKRHKVVDRSKIYIDQAWVGRGPYGQLPDYRARGQINIMRTPWTSLTVLLKEETTRVREWREREGKRRKQLLGDLWTHLPDRPVQWQRQWYTF